MLCSIRWTTACCAILSAALMFLSLGCGSSGSSMNSNLSPAQAQAVSHQLTTTLSSALGAGLGTPVVANSRIPHLPEIVSRAHAAHSQLPDCTISQNGESCSIPISYNGPCPNGGTISASGDFVFSLDLSGTGSDSSTLTVTPTNCAVSDLTFNGNPNVTLKAHFGLQNDVPVYPMTFKETGGISFGPNPSGSCSLNVTMTVTSSTACTVSGNVCGQPVSGSC